MNNKIAKQAEQRTLWLRRIDDYERSGLTLRAYCEQHGFSRTIFYRRRRDLKPTTVSKKNAPYFIPVALPLDSPIKKSHEDEHIQFSIGGAVFKLPSSMTANAMSQVFQALRLVS